MPETITDEERLNSFASGLDSFKPEGFEEENWNRLKEAVVSFHKEDVQKLKDNSAKIKQEKTELMSRCQALEATGAKSAQQIEALNRQLETNQSEEQKKLSENQTIYEKQIADLTSRVKKLETEKTELEKGVLERDVLTEFNKAAGEKDWLGGGREAAQKIVLTGIEFSRLKTADGSVALIDKKTSKDVRTILNDFCGTELGKSFLRSGTRGGGADGSATNDISGKRMTRAQYDALSAKEQMDKVLDGWKIVS